MVEKLDPKQVATFEELLRTQGGMQMKVRSKRGPWIALAVVAFAMTLWPLSAESQYSDVPDFILTGLDAYTIGGTQAMMRVWLKDSPIRGSKEEGEQEIIIRQAEDFYGTYESYQIIHVTNLTPSTRIIYLAIDYMSGPLFGRIVAYKTKTRWVLTEMKFSTTSEKVLRPIVWAERLR